MAEVTVVKRLPECSFCRAEGVSTPARYDGRTVLGPWAYMCTAHWDLFGPGRVGTGHGQRLILEATMEA